jgi:two-component system KDP operon response regulator KdpE
MTAEGRILIIDDEVQIRRFLRICLTAHGYDVIEAARGETGLARAGESGPDIVILDLGLPDMDGAEVIRRLREWMNAPILVLSVRAEEAQKVAALEAGANDYVTKPFGIAELIARVRVLLRSRRAGTGETAEAAFESDGLRIDYPARRVFLDDAEVHLTRKEFDLLRILSRHAGNVLTHDALLRQVWGEAHVGETHYLRIHIGHLRQKLNDDPNAPRFIWTEPGVGYRLSGPRSANT